MRATLKRQWVEANEMKHFSVAKVCFCVFFARVLMHVQQQLETENCCEQAKQEKVLQENISHFAFYIDEED